MRVWEQSAESVACVRYELGPQLIVLAVPSLTVSFTKLQLLVDEVLIRRLSQNQTTDKTK